MRIEKEKKKKKEKATIAHSASLDSGWIRPQGKQPPLDGYNASPHKHATQRPLHEIEVASPNSFEQKNHFYPKALNSYLHPMVNCFFGLDHDRIIKRYGHLNPKADTQALRDVLTYQCKHFYWGGADLLSVATEVGNRESVVLETNSCPSGQNPT